MNSNACTFPRIRVSHVENISYLTHVYYGDEISNDTIFIEWLILEKLHNSKSLVDYSKCEFASKNLSNKNHENICFIKQEDLTKIQDEVIDD